MSSTPMFWNRATVFDDAILMLANTVCRLNDSRTISSVRRADTWQFSNAAVAGAVAGCSDRTIRLGRNSPTIRLVGASSCDHRYLKKFTKNAWCLRSSIAWSRTVSRTTAMTPSSEGMSCRMEVINVSNTTTCRSCTRS